MPAKSARLIIIASALTAGLLGAAAASLQVSQSAPATAAVIPATALPVQTAVIEPQSHYILHRTFSGQVQARRQAELGFERGGRLLEVLVDEGAIVKKGQLLAELDRERLTAQRAELEAARAEAEARLSLAKVTTQRFQDVINKGGVSKQRLDEARENQRAALAAVRLAEQRILSVEVELDKTHLFAPFDAIVISRLADEGRVMDMGRPVLNLLERSQPEIRIGIAGRSLQQLQPGQSYTLTWQDQPIQATLRALLPVRLSSARTVEALFDPLDAPASMFPGDLVTISLSKTVEQNGFWIPLDALTEGERGLWSVFIARQIADPATATSSASHRIERRSVNVISQENDRVFVSASLDSGDNVVTGGVHRIVPGQLVRLGSENVEVALQ